MLAYRNIYSNNKLTPAQKNYQTALINDWIDNNGKSSRSVNYLIKIDYRTASKSILAEKGFTPSTVIANEPEENVEVFKTKQYIYKTIPNEFFLDDRLTQAEKAYLIAIDFSWIKYDGQQMLPVCHLETVCKYFDFVKINTLKKYIKKMENKGYIKYTSNRNGITNVSIDYTGNYKSIPEEFETAENEINSIINPVIENNYQKQIDELKELIITLQKQVIEQQKQIDELKANKAVETTGIGIPTETITPIIEEDYPTDIVDDEANIVNFSIMNNTNTPTTNTPTIDSPIEDEDCSLELLEQLEQQSKTTPTAPTAKKPVPEFFQSSLMEIMKADLFHDVKNDGLADLQHRSTYWNDLEGAEELQRNIVERKNNREELTDYIINYINSHKDIRNTVNCLDTTYYKIFFTLAKTRVNDITNTYWKRNIPTMDLSLVDSKVA